METSYRRLYDVEDELEFQKYELSWKRLHQCNAKLASSSEMATLMSFFAVTAAVELKLVEGETNEELIIALTVTTSLLVAVTMIIKTVTCSIIPYLESVINVSEISDVLRSPHEELIFFINITWLFATILLPFLFVTDFIIMTIIKFSFYTMEGVYAVLLILLPLLIIILASGVTFLRQTIKPDKGCIALSKSTKNPKKFFDKNSSFVYRRGSDWLSESTDSNSTISTSTYWEENKLPLLQGRSFTKYSSFESTLVNPNIYYGFID